MNYIGNSLDDFRSPIHIWTVPDWGAETARGLLDIAMRAVHLYEEKFDLPYPLPKLDLVAVPDGVGGIEKWGYITFEPVLRKFKTTLVRISLLDMS
jgi:aminopeptidase 2